MLNINIKYILKYFIQNLVISVSDWSFEGKFQGKNQPFWREQANNYVSLTIKFTSAAAAIIVVANLLRYKNGLRLWRKSENLAEVLCWSEMCS